MALAMTIAIFATLFPLIKLAKKLKACRKNRNRKSTSSFTFPLIKLAKKLKDIAGYTIVITHQVFPLIKLAKKLKADTLEDFVRWYNEKFPLIKLAKKLKV